MINITMGKRKKKKKGERRENRGKKGKKGIKERKMTKTGNEWKIGKLLLREKIKMVGEEGEVFW